jgi:hypothetical protein
MTYLSANRIVVEHAQNFRQIILLPRIFHIALEQAGGARDSFSQGRFVLLPPSEVIGLP